VASTNLVKRIIVVFLVAVCAGIAAPKAQLRVVPLDDLQGHVALGLALRHLNNAGIFMMATAHPDDENNALLVMLNRGLGYRTALATATRGNGGQNEIGPELFEALGVLRTQELAAIHRFDGAEQYFTRAVDFGYSFSIEETFEKWGHDEILADYVRLIRMVRPDVIAGLSPTGIGGGQHHQASAILAREAFLAAGDATKFPDQIAQGLRPWQPKKFYFATQFGGPPDPNAPPPTRVVDIDLTGYDRLLGKTYAEIGSEARSMHKCQGMDQLLALPGPRSVAYDLVETRLPAGREPEASLFDGLDTSIDGLAQFAGSQPPQALRDGLSAISAAAQNAQRRFDAENDAATSAPLAEGLRAVRSLRAQLGSLDLADAARFELDFRLGQKEREFQQAILLAGGIHVEALANDGVVVPGQPVRLSVIVANNGTADVAVKSIGFSGFERAASCELTPATSGAPRGAAPPAPPLSVLRSTQVGQCSVPAAIPQGARVSEPYWHRAREAGRYTFDEDAPFGLPYRPTAFYTNLSLTVGGSEVTERLPIEYRYEGDIFGGEKRSELLVVPALSVRVSPDIAVFPITRLQTTGSNAEDDASASREIRATVVNNTAGAATTLLDVDVPRGWVATPAQQTVTFTREDESKTVRFAVRPPVSAPAGDVSLRAHASFNGATFDRGFQVIEYPHIRRQHIYEPAEATLKRLDVRVAPDLTVGYVMGVGDQVPQAIEQLGVRVEMIDADDLAWGDLSRFDTIVTGVRAYERRADLRANNSRLIDYVRAGGTLIVQYNKFEFNAAQYGPYPAKVSSTRVSDEFGPVRVLAPDDPVFTVPNQVSDATWKDWVQERGLYFLGSDHDPRYRELLAIDEPFPLNRGEKRGALVEAQYGQGHWVYVGLGLWRELPAGVDGAYELFANLISLGHTQAAR
jgi:LmbE family N-acetylglucosaminyl deacetylase